MLHGAADKHEPRLDWYEAQDDYKSNPTLFRSMYVEQMADVGIYTSEGNRFTFEIYPKEEDAKHVYAAKNEVELNSWMKALRQALQECRNCKVPAGHVAGSAFTTKNISGDESVFYEASVDGNDDFLFNIGLCKAHFCP